jgi:AraC-like DNA-binding protein
VKKRILKYIIVNRFYILSIILFTISINATFAHKNVSIPEGNNILNNNNSPIYKYVTNHFLKLKQDLNKQNKTQEELSEEYRQLAKIYTDSVKADKAVFYAEEYIRLTADLSIINDHFFYNIKDTDLYLNFKNRYGTHFNFLSLFYLFAGFLGLFIGVLLNLKRGIHRKSTFLIGLFVLFNSIFIIHLSLYLINYHYYFPHTLLMSTAFTLFYGPLIYFYFKITVTDYKLKWINSLHLLPALILLVFIFPFYTLSAKEKFVILFDQEDILLSEANYIMVVKIISLVIYAILTMKMYYAAKNKSSQKSRKLIWQRNIIAIYCIYIIAYVFFIATTSGVFDTPAFFHLQILVMVGLVFYVAYITYVQPEIFKGEVKLVDPINIFKYKTSSLTPSYSEELRDELLMLLDKDKVHRENNISLQILSEKLETSRHNTSQVINEHFGLNFFELINKYRIEDAVKIFNNNDQDNLTIIEVAYKVGFNNKVTFNKSFKRHLSQTPSEYIKSIKS